MSIDVDPRLVARRRTVQEGWARRRLRWMVALVVAVLLVGAGIAVIESPWLAIRSVVVDGAENAPTAEILAAQGVTPGTPTFSVRSGTVEEALRNDPWVADAEVRVTWPGTIEVTVIERTPAAWVRLEDGWGLAAVDGFIITAGEPAEGEPVVSTPVAEAAVGERITAPDLLGAVEFLGHLSPELAAGAVAVVTPDGIEAEVAGHRVLAGNGRDIRPKVATLEAMIEAGVERDAVLNVISPTRPGTLNPQSVVESIGGDVSSLDETG